jgi:hypothetical protein
MAPTITEECPLSFPASQSAIARIVEEWPLGAFHQAIIRIGLLLNLRLRAYSTVLKGMSMNLILLL